MKRKSIATISIVCENSPVFKQKKKVNTNADVVYFYDEKAENGLFSNFYECSEKNSLKLIINGKSWKTVEHFFQASKFLGSNETPKSREYSELIRNASTANIAKILAGQKLGGGYPWRTKLNPVITEFLNYHVTLRPDWDSVKETIMKEVIVAKFTQNVELKASLLATGNKLLVEHTTRDSYWGDGGDGTGQNRLGHILMAVRSEMMVGNPIDTRIL